MARWFVFLAGAALVACANKAGPAVSAAQVTSGAMPTGVYAPAGERVTIRLDRQLDTGTSSAGESFVAHLVDPLRAADGRVLATPGASLEGHIESIDLGAAAARMRLAFDRIETVRGVRPLAVRIVSATYRSVPGELRRTPTGTQVQVPARVVMPAGATITLELVRPIVVGAQ